MRPLSLIRAVRTPAGFTVLARLSQETDKLRLTIWGGGPGSPAVAEGDPQFNNAAIELSAHESERAALAVRRATLG